MFGLGTFGKTFLQCRPAALSKGSRLTKRHEIDSFVRDLGGL